MDDFCSILVSAPGHGVYTTMAERLPMLNLSSRSNMSTPKSRRLARVSQVSVLVVHDSHLGDRVDSRVFAERCNVTHRTVFGHITSYLSDFEEFGQLVIQAQVGERIQGGGNPQRYALLNEDHCYLLLTYLRNVEQSTVRELKKNLVKEFGKLRRQAKRQASLDWQQSRASSALEFRQMCTTVHDRREEQGKKTEPYHYANEAKLVNWALTGEYKPLDREQLSAEDLDLLCKLEYQNTRMLNRDIPREERKQRLKDYAEDVRCRVALPPLALSALQLGAH